MGYAVELFLRDDESKAISELFSATRSILANIGTTPHISLAVFNDVDVPKLTRIVRTFAACTAPFAMRFSSVGVFPGEENVVFLAPVVTASVLELHASLHEQLAVEGLSCHPYYLPGEWVPHLAVTMEEPIIQSTETIKAIHDADVLGDYTIDNVNVVQFRPVVTLSQFRLGLGNAE
jgi:2'-5' RNA ligase